MGTRKSGPLDAMVGVRIRMFRLDRGMSQTILAERIGVTFQQVQKYERGADRVGASRLSQIASVLGVSVGELFKSSGAESAGSPALRAWRLGRPQVPCANEEPACAAFDREAG
jgi:transcriptional regulator with XRE-family HTH domain